MTTAEQRPTPEIPHLQEFFESRRDAMQGDEGFIAMAGVMAALANSKPLRRAVGYGSVLVGFGLWGLYHNFANRIHDNPAITTQAPEATYLGSFTYDAPEICFGGYQSHLKTSAEYSHKIDIDVPLLGQKTLDTHYYVKSSADMDVTNVVCAKATELTGVWSKDNKTVNVTLGPNTFQSYVFVSDPVNGRKIEHDHSFLATPANLLSDTLKGLEEAPLIGGLASSANVTDSDKLQNTLDGVAELRAFKEATESCGKVSMADAGADNGPYAQALATEIAREKNIPVASVHVDMPSAESFKLTDQYTEPYKNLMATEPVKQGNITIDNQQGAVCKPSADHGNVVTLPSGALQANLGGAA